MLGMSMFTRPGHTILYSEAPAMLLRGLLFNAPYSLREHYAPLLSPISLGGDGKPDHFVGNQLTQEEIALVQEYYNAMKAVPIPSPINQVSAEQYVNQILDITDKYIPRLQYFKDDLSTIRGNIESRTVLTAPPKAVASGYGSLATPPRSPSPDISPEEGTEPGSRATSPFSTTDIDEDHDQRLARYKKS